MIVWLMITYTLGQKAMSFPSVEPDWCGVSSCQDQYLSKITGNGKTLFKSLIADDTQLVQKFETLWGAEYAYGTMIYLPQIM